MTFQSDPALAVAAVRPSPILTLEPASVETKLGEEATIAARLTDLSGAEVAGNFFWLSSRPGAPAVADGRIEAKEGGESVDISGELRGELYRQGREIASCLAYGPQGKVPRRALALGLLLAAGPSGAVAGIAQEAPSNVYYAFAAAESQDEVSLIRFGPAGAEVVRTTTVGLFPLETDGPHGLATAPDGSHWFVSLAHGLPFGQVHKYTTADDRKVGAAEVGLFPASMQVSPAGLLFVVNFNLHGDMVPSSVSVLETGTMMELARIPTCAMPHGSRLTAGGELHYSTCMMDEQLVEVDARLLAVRRRLFLLPRQERALAPDVQEALPAAGGEHAAHGSGGAPEARCAPTWAHPSPDGRFVYVACNRNREVLEVDAATWEVSRRFATGPGPYNLDVTPDGRLLIVTYKAGQAVGVWDLASGNELAAIPTTRRLPHGIAITPDSRYAFISVEGVGGEPGMVDVIDLRALRKVGSVDMGKQAGGIAFWRMEAAG